ncbi:MAG TPA: hypothetical protein VF892_03030 [Pseudonocardiaceae bacterium]
MSTRISIAVVAVLTIILGCLSGIATTSSASADEPDCSVVFFDISLGQGVEAFCDDAPGTFQVIAQCSDDLDFWSAAGNLAEAGDEPSVAECHGVLLFPAHVVSYFIAR